jgi:DNA-binding response OmpR family regulator
MDASAASSAGELLGWRTAALPATPALAEPHLLLLAAGEPAAAESWGRQLAAEGTLIECRSLASITSITSSGGGSLAGESVSAQAIVLYVPDALAPHLNELRTLRARWTQPPLLVVIRGLRDLDQVLALEMGADDVIDAASAAPVAAARLRALWRRAAARSGVEREPPRELRFGSLRLRRLEREVRLADEPVPLTEGEFEVLWLLASHAGQALSRRDILKSVRGLDDQPLDRSIDSRVYRIRAKLGDSGSSPPRIRTVRHQGYAFSPTGW